jgi:hypothetical protein
MTVLRRSVVDCSHSSTAEQYRRRRRVQPMMVFRPVVVVRIVIPCPVRHATKCLESIVLCATTEKKTYISSVRADQINAGSRIDRQPCDAFAFPTAGVSASTMYVPAYLGDDDDDDDSLATRDECFIVVVQNCLYHHCTSGAGGRSRRTR